MTRTISGRSSKCVGGVRGGVRNYVSGIVEGVEGDRL